MANVQTLLRRLSEIERSIGVIDSLSIRRMVLETQDYILESQRESVEAYRPKQPRLSAHNARLWCVKYFPGSLHPQVKNHCTPQGEASKITHVEYVGDNPQ